MRPPLPTMGSTPWSCDRGTTRDQVRPHGFSPPRRFRHTTVSGSIAPQNQTGSAAFPIRVTRIRRWWPLTYLPQQRIHTLRRFPLAGSRTASLRPLPPRRSPSHRTIIDLTVYLALDNSGPACASWVRRPTPACRMVAASLIAEGHPTMDRRLSGQSLFPAFIFHNRTLHTLRYDHLRVSAPMTHELPSLAALACCSSDTFTPSEIGVSSWLFPCRSEDGGRYRPMLLRLPSLAS